MPEFLQEAKRTIYKTRSHFYDNFVMLKVSLLTNEFCMKFNTTIVVVNNVELSPQEELVQDIVSILHVFSCRLYGLRKYKKQIKKDEGIAKELQDGDQSDRRTESQNSQDNRNL